MGSRHIVGCLLYLGMQLSSIETKQGLIWSNLIARMHQNSQNAFGYGIRNIELLARIENTAATDYVLRTLHLRLEERHIGAGAGT